MRSSGIDKMARYHDFKTHEAGNLYLDLVYAVLGDDNYSIPKTSLKEEVASGPGVKNAGKFVGAEGDESLAREQSGLAAGGGRGMWRGGGRGGGSFLQKKMSSRLHELARHARQAVEVWFVVRVYVRV